MSETTWYHAKDGEALGPFTFAQLREMVVAGTIGPVDLLCQVGKTDWVPALSVPGLFPPPPPLPGTKRKLVPCAKCGAQVSDEAETCPHCGEHQPKWDQKEYGWPGDSCDKCGVFNIVSTGYGKFLDQPSNQCRGCGCPLTEASPGLHLESEMQRVYANSKETGHSLGCVAAVISFFGYFVYGPDGGGMVARLLVAAGGYIVASSAVGFVVRRLAARVGFGDRSPRANMMAGREWNFAHRYRNRYAPKGAAAVANTSRSVASTVAEWGCSIAAVLYIAVALGAALFLDRGPPKPELPVHVSFRTSDVGKGMVLIMRNTSQVPLKDLSFTITSPAGKKAGEISKTLLKPLEPQATFEVGWAELGGWELSPGETVKIWMPTGNYKPIEATVPAKAPSR